MTRKRVGSALMGTGIFLFLLAACCMDSEAEYMFLAGGMAAVGLALALIGHLMTRNRDKPSGID